MDHNRELIGLGAANIGSGSMSGMTVNGSAGARSQVSGLVVAVLTVVTLLGLIIGIVVSLLLLLYRTSPSSDASSGRPTSSVTSSATPSTRLRWTWR